MRRDEQARGRAAELGQVALQLHAAEQLPDLLAVTAGVAAGFFGCPRVGVASLGPRAVLLDVAGPAAELVRTEVADPASAWRRSVEANEAMTTGAEAGGTTHVPLVPGRGRAVGVLSLYWSREIADPAYLGPFCTHVAVAMESLWYQTRLQTSMDAHRLVSSSLGILMERYGIDSRQAYDVLSDVSLQHKVRLREIARRVVDDRDLLASN
ncbi:ANTAR domain-containing protein [Kribbella sp. WER1]